jgi:sporulation protein YlmC with PRC-barrel domain
MPTRRQETTMIDQGSVPSLMGSTVRDSSGDKIGKVGQVYLDDTTGQPEWITVRTGLFGTRESFVPLAAARVEGDGLVVDVAKERVTGAPQIDEDGHLSEEQEAELYSYYGVSPGAFGREVGPTGSGGPAGYAAGTSGTDPGEYAGTSAMPAAETAEAAFTPGPAYAGSAASSSVGVPATSHAGDPALVDPELSRRDTDVVEAIDPDSPALAGPGSASGTAGDVPPRPATPAAPDVGPVTTGEAFDASRHEDAWTVAEEEADERGALSQGARARLRRWIAPADDPDRRA